MKKKGLAICAIVLLCCGLSRSTPASPITDKTDYRWLGHDFAFCFITDDGKLSNLAWADTARAMGFRFTIAVNLGLTEENPTSLSYSQIHQLAEDGFEIAQHGFSHGWDGLDDSCSVPPRGSLLGYFLCDQPDEATRMQYLAREIERDSFTTLCDIPAEEIRTVAYPRHRHNKALIDRLIAEGYLGARTGGRWDEETNSYGDFTQPARNGWDEGISLYRVPIAIDDKGLFGDHSADPPVHYTYEQFLAAAMPKIDEMRQSGGIMVVFTHHLGDDDDSYGDINYHSGGVTKRDLAWIVDLVRDNGGLVLPFGEAVAYYRSRTVHQLIDGDHVWMPATTAVNEGLIPGVTSLRVFPNPFNPRTAVSYDLPAGGDVRVGIFDLAGHLVNSLAAGFQPAGHHELVWDGRDGQGRAVGAGVYFLNISTAGGDSRTEKLVLIK